MSTGPAVAAAGNEQSGAWTVRLLTVSTCDAGSANARSSRFAGATITTSAAECAITSSCAMLSSSGSGSTTVVPRAPDTAPTLDGTSTVTPRWRSSATNAAEPDDDVLLGSSAGRVGLDPATASATRTSSPSTTRTTGNRA